MFYYILFFFSLIIMATPLKSHSTRGGALVCASSHLVDIKRVEVDACMQATCAPSPHSQQVYTRFRSKVEHAAVAFIVS